MGQNQRRLGRLDNDSPAIRRGQVRASTLVFPTPSSSRRSAVFRNRVYPSARVSISSSYACRTWSASSTPSAPHRECDLRQSGRASPHLLPSECPSSEKLRQMSPDCLLERIPALPKHCSDTRCKCSSPSAEVHHDERVGLTVATVTEVALRTAAVIPVAVESPAIRSPAPPRNGDDPGDVVRERPRPRRARYMARNCPASLAGKG